MANAVDATASVPKTASATRLVSRCSPRASDDSGAPMSNRFASEYIGPQPGMTLPEGRARNSSRLTAVKCLRGAATDYVDRTIVKRGPRCRSAVPQPVGSSSPPRSSRWSAVGWRAQPPLAVITGFEIEVNVVGPVPAGTTFTVDVTCPGNTPSSASFTFDSTGTPTPSNIVNITNFPTTCTATESQTGGAATVTSACSDTGVAACTNDHTASFATSGPGVGTITFTDGYLPPLTVTPPTGSPGQSFTVSSTGCTKALFGGSAGTGSTVQVTAAFTPPIVMNVESAPTTGAWSTAFTVPANASGGPIPVSATCADPAPYPSGTSFTVLAAAAAVIANPAFTG